MNMLVYGHKGSVQHDPLQSHVIILFVYKGIMERPM